MQTKKVMKSEIKNVNNHPDTITIWVTASRPHTLTASICPCIVSYVANYKQQLFTVYDSILWIIFCITVQLGTNLHNDYSDYIKGADTKETRIGHIRATAAGWLSPYETCIGATLCLCITLVCGIIIIIVNNQIYNIFLWFIILSSIFNAFAYTAGPYPLGYIGLQNYSIAYYGLGDIFVFVYFGLVATYMIPYILYLRNSDSSSSSSSNNKYYSSNQQQQHLLLPSNYISQIIYGIQIGLLAMNILVVNNLRDRLTDVLANKLTTSVRFGRLFSIIQYISCIAITYTLVIINTVFQVLHSSNNNRSTVSIVLSILLSLLPLVSLPFAIIETISVIKKEGAALNIHVGGAAKVQTLFCILTAISIYLSDSFIG